jgi:hypothetical protein
MKTMVVNNDHLDPPISPFDFFGFGYVATAGPHFHEQDNDLGNLLNSNAEQEHGWP